MMLVAPLLTACYEGEGIETLSVEQDPVPVYIHVSADVLGDLNATRATDPYAESGEFMNTLCVFVVDETGTIEAKFGPDILEGYTAAETGDLTDWTSDKITLTAGTKTIYAFSNWETADSEDGDWAKLIAKEVGETIEDSDLNFVVDDPASKVDIENGKYIPMSGKATAVVSSTADLNYNQLVDVGMDRLVGKVTIAINGETSNIVNGVEQAQAVTLGDLTFSGWADKVPMMSDDASTYEYTYDENYSAELNKEIEVGATGVSLASFYVNETFRPTEAIEDVVDGYGYEITLNTDRYGGTYYTATTERYDIERNCIYPITLTLDNNVLDLEVTAWTDPLGIEEVPYVNIEVDGDTYIVTLIDKTSTFQLSPSMLYNGTAVTTATWDWTYDNTSDGSQITYEDDGSVIVTSLTATPGYSYSFTLVANWTTTSSSSVTTTHSRTYNILVTLVEGWPEFDAPARKSSWKIMVGGSELINLLLNSKRAEL